ncbi:hypothetical protein V8F33_008274 [Rhypophila sp. PSN 637]
MGFFRETWEDSRIDDHFRTDMTEAIDKIGVPHMGHGARRRLCMGVNKTFYGILSPTLHFFKLERASLNDSGMKTVFPQPVQGFTPGV